VTIIHRMHATIDRHVASQITRRGSALDVTVIVAECSPLPAATPALATAAASVLYFLGGELAAMEAARLIRLLTNVWVNVAVVRDINDAIYAFY